MHLILLLFIFIDLLNVNNTLSFVKQLLKNSPKIDQNKELWRFNINLTHLSDIDLIMKYRRSTSDIAQFGNLTLTLSRSLEVPTPSYVQVILDDT